jgi:SAM-dependent methyltransferase
MAQPHAINARAQSGFAKSAAYDEHRPTYSPTATEYLLQQLKVAGKRHAKVLDLAAGTGKFTEGLARRAEDFEIVAVEPHDGMRAVLEAKGLQHVSVENGVADRIPLESESVDAVVAAQVGHLPTLTSGSIIFHGSRALVPAGGHGASSRLPLLHALLDAG